MAELRRAARTDEDMTAWAERWVTGPADHDEVLELLGRDRLAALVHGERRAASEPRTGDLTPDERMTLAAVRVQRERVRERAADAVLAGIGYAHLAVWTAVTGMQEAGGWSSLPSSASIRVGLDFEALVAGDLAPEPAPDARDVVRLRAFDPQGVFLR